MAVVNKKKRGREPSPKKSQDVSSQVTFVLKDINANNVLFYHYRVPEETSNDEGNRSRFPISKDDQETVLDFDGQNIGIADLLHEKSKKTKRSIMFLDPHKGHVKFWGVMLDLTLNGPLPRYTPKPCWHCRNKFSYHPIGCPIRYSKQKDKGLSKTLIEERFTELNLSLENGNDYFETEGIFCTFPCVKSFILNQISMTKSPKYKRALTLLTLLYLKIFGVLIKIPTAGTWKLTADWGGHMTPHEFRASTGLLEYTETINTKRPYMFCSSGWIREKRVK